MIEPNLGGIMAFLTFLLLSLQSAFGLNYSNHIYDAHGKKSDLNHVLASVQSGDVVIVGENHGFYPHHETQLKVVSNLQNLGFTVDVGIEHVPYTLQQELDDFIIGKSTEERFLQKIGWPKSNLTCLDYTKQEGFLDPYMATPFDCYTPTLRGAYDGNGNAVAINLSRKITSKVARSGIDSLTLLEKTQLPPNYQWGSQSYFERFRELMLSFGGKHGNISDEQIERMFWAQSLWDDTMAYQSLQHMKKNPNNVMVIVVGDFHAAFGDGLAARFYARGAKNVHIVSQAFMYDGDPAFIDMAGQPDKRWGAAGNLLVITNIKSDTPSGIGTYSAKQRAWTILPSINPQLLEPFRSSSVHY